MEEEKEKKSYQELCSNVNSISKPLASEKVVHKLSKLLGAASKRKTCTRRGVKEVVKSIRKGSKG